MRHVLIVLRRLPFALVVMALLINACNIGGNIQEGLSDGTQKQTAPPQTVATTQATDSNTPPVSPRNYALLQTSQQKTQCVTLGADGNVVLQHCCAGDNQFWSLEHNQLRSMTGFCLTVQPAAEAGAQPVLQAVACRPTDDAQTFTFDGQTIMTSDGYCLDLKAAATAQNTSVIMQTCSAATSPSQTFVWDVFTYSAASLDTNVTRGSGKYTTLAWADEFNGMALDSNMWGFEVNCDGGGNHEAECYTQDANNLFVDRQGRLVMQVLKMSGLSNGKTYSSARITTQYKVDYLYGRLEARLKIPVGGGMWPAFWTMPTDSVYGAWPTSGELDIMENVGRNPNTLYGTAHFGVPNPYTQLGGTLDDPNITQGFHTYAIERDPNQVRWYYDDKLYFTARSTDTTFWPSGYTPPDATSWPFEQNFYVIFNVAIGGDFGGGIDPNIVGDAMVIDWVRLYR